MSNQHEALRLRQVNFRDVWEVASALEPLCAALAARQITADELALLERSLARTEAIVAADQWLASQPVNQCGETCERASLCAVCARGIGEPDPESLSRQMFVARLENMQKGGGALTASAVSALLSDCDMLAANDR